MTRHSTAARVSGTTAKCLGAALSALTLTATLAACSDSEENTVSTSPADSNDSSDSNESGTDSEGSWPRTIETKDGKGEDTDVTINAQPKNIVSTSVTLTGGLLALDAPVKATGVQGKSNAIADDKGFFTQWAEEANEAGVEVAYEREPNVEAILAQDPDLVVMSASGADSALSVYDQIADVVPVVVVDYNDAEWSDTLEELGEATGYEAKAKEAIKAYEERVEEVKKAITQPEQPVNIVSLGQGDGTINVWTEESPQGRLLKDLGWELAVPEKQYGGGNPQFDGRKDVVSVAAENFGPALTGKTIAVINPDGSGDPVETIKGYEQLADNEAVKNDNVVVFPPEFFRIDYFSALDTLDFIEKTYK